MIVCRSSAVITFTAPKPAHLFAQLTRGPIVVAPDRKARGCHCLRAESPCGYPPGSLRLFAPRQPESNKGRFGHVLVVAGSLGKSGAAAICGWQLCAPEPDWRPWSLLLRPANRCGICPELMTKLSAIPAPQRRSRRCRALSRAGEIAQCPGHRPGLSQRPGVAEFVHRLVRARTAPSCLTPMD